MSQALGGRRRFRVRAPLIAVAASAPLSAQPAGAGWGAERSNELAASRFGGTVEVPVYVTRTPGAVRSTTVSLAATSESDPSATATATCVVDVAATTVR